MVNRCLACLPACTPAHHLFGAALDSKCLAELFFAPASSCTSPFMTASSCAPKQTSCSGAEETLWGVKQGGWRGSGRRVSPPSCFTPLVFRRRGNTTGTTLWGRGGGARNIDRHCTKRPVALQCSSALPVLPPLSQCPSPTSLHQRPRSALSPSLSSRRGLSQKAGRPTSA